MKLNEEPDFSLEVTLLMAFGLVMLVLGAVLVLAAGGIVPFYQDGMFGLFLILCGLELQMVGKNPFKPARRSWPVLIFGIIITVTGFVTYFVPGFSGDIPRILSFLIFGVGGMVLLFQVPQISIMYPFREMSARICRCYTLGCMTACILIILIAALIAIRILLPVPFPYGLFAFICLLLGCTFFFLATILYSVCHLLPEPGISTYTPCMSLVTVMEMQYGFFMLVSGCLLVPVYLGLLPFCPGAQMGTLVVLLGIQTLVVGNIMTITCTRTWIIYVIGMICVAGGTSAILVPDLLVPFMSLSIAFFNISGGLYLLYILFRPKPESEKTKRALERKDLILLISLLILAILTAVLMIIIGVSIIFISRVQGIAFAMCLIGFGMILFLLYYVRSLAKRKNLL